MENILEMKDSRFDSHIEIETLSKVDQTLFEIKPKIEALQNLLLSITDLDFSKEETIQVWENIIEHRNLLSSTLNREVHLSTAISDYFTHVHKVLKSPLVMEYSHLIKLQMYASMDFLTGIYNRYFFQEVMGKELSRASRSKTNFTLALFDINGFKLINDTYGHQTGDKVLANIALIIKTMMRAQDIPCRYGGDEFICLLPDTNYFYALGIVERLTKKISDLSAKMELDLKLSATYGLSTYPWDGQKVDELIKACDVRLYYFKSANKDGILEERRGAQRVKTSGTGLLHTDRTDHTVELLDISSHGIGFKCQEPTLVGSSYQIDLLLDPPFSSAKAVIEVSHLSELAKSFKVGARFKEIAFAT